MNDNGLSTRPMRETLFAERREEISKIQHPSRNPRVLYVERLKGSEREEFIIVSESLYGFLTHWVERKTVPCWQNHALCEGGHSEDTLRENFLVQAWSMRKNRHVFVYLTPSAAAQLEDQITPGTSLKGVPILVCRTKGDKGRLNVSISQFTSVQKLSSREVDPWESIMHFLRVPKHVRDERRPLRSFRGEASPG